MSGMFEMFYGKEFTHLVLRPNRFRWNLRNDPFGHVAHSPLEGFEYQNVNSKEFTNNSPTLHSPIAYLWTASSETVVRSKTRARPGR